MKFHFPPGQDVAGLWFARTAPVLCVGDAELPTELESMSPHGARLHVTSAGAWEPEGMQTVRLAFRHPERSARIVVRAAITGFSRGATGWRLVLTFLRIIENVAIAAESESHPEEIECPETFRAVLWGDHPWYFNYRIQLSVLAFRNGRIRVAVHGEGRGLIADLPLEFEAALPGAGVFRIKATVTEINIGQDGKPAEAVLMVLDPSAALGAAVSRYLFMAVPGIDSEQMERLGFPLPDFEFAGEFSFAQTPQEMSEVLALRLFAYSQRQGSSLADVTDPEIMRDPFDAHALILTVKVGGRMVGTTRLVFNNGDRSRSEIAALCDLPEWMWEKGFVELSRSATLPGLRGRDVFPSLRRQAIRSAHNSGHRYILSDCEGHLLQPYLRRGARELGITFVHPLEGKTLHVLYYDVPALLQGEGDPETWSRLWKPMADFISGIRGKEGLEPD